jgi:hypothetical protein
MNNEMKKFRTLNIQHPTLNIERRKRGVEVREGRL